MTEAAPIAMSDHTISAVVPCFNEEACIEEAHARISAALEQFGDHEIIFIDDGSTDSTLERIRQIANADQRVRYVSFSKNFGLEAAFSAGYRYARYPWMAQFDADLQSPPEEVSVLFAKALEGFDAVFSERRDRQDPLYRRLGSRVQQLVARRLLHIEMPYRSSIFRVLRTSVARKVMETDLGMPYFLATIPLIGAKYTTVPTAHRPRMAGESKWNLRRLASHTMDLYIGFSTRPLTVGVTLATIILGFAALAGVSGLMSQTMTVRMLAVGQLAIGAAVAVSALYLIRIIRGQHRNLRLFLIRECNFPILPSDSLYEFELGPVDKAVHHHAIPRSDRPIEEAAI